MLTSTELAIIYTEPELLSQMQSLKLLRNSVSTSGTISTVQTRDLTVSYGNLSKVEDIDKALRGIAGALYILSPSAYPNPAGKVLRYYTV